MTSIVIIGGGPAGYEAALVAAQLGAEVTVVERDGMGGACVLADCVPSKTFIASSGALTSIRDSGSLGVRAGDVARASLDPATVHGRVLALAAAQSADIHGRLEREGVRLLAGSARLADATPGMARHLVRAEFADGVEDVDADIVLLATGADPRILPGGEPDGERILTWRQVYDLQDFPEHLVVVGSGVTGAEFASGYLEAGVPVTMVSSRDRVLPGEDADAAEVLEQVFMKRGGQIAKQARASGVRTDGSSVVVLLEDGREVRGSHALMTVGSVPNSAGLGLESAGVSVTSSGHILVDKVSRTNVAGIYAAGDVTGVWPLASVAAMQGRVAMWHALGEAVSPIKLKTVAANVFTHPEIATVGHSEKVIAERGMAADTIMLPLATNARAKMVDLRDGFVKLFCRRPTGVVIGGVVVAPVASELILPIALAVQNNLTAADLAHTFSIYPSLSGTITEAGRRLMAADDLI
ncbi:MAG: NAD(P)H-quinone dehydrogenase [Actinomycetota bacterium]|nr:NAD(P)H-quinone dehydrogenase [Actinomycetota bacterium]